MNEDLNAGDCVRCDRKGLIARTRGGLCWWCAREDPTLPGWLLELRGVQSLTRGDLVDLRNTVHRVTRGKGGRPTELTWRMVVTAYEALRSEGDKPTQEKVAERVGFEVRAVQECARKNGGWPPNP